ncbi:MAG: sel1 repeat family protein [Acholeplasmatales bacterium]|nr:sel1 repeat family protein [Acholeplasmatales bacterium]
MVIDSLEKLLIEIHNSKNDFEDIDFDDSFKFDDFKNYLKQNENNLDAITFLGLCHKRGYCVSYDLDKAFKCFSYASNRGNARAKYQLSLLYTYVEHDEEKALEFLVDAAKLNEPKAEYDLAIRFYAGIYIDKDFDKYKILIERAANHGSIDAMYDLLLQYLKNNDIDKINNLSKLILEKNDSLSLLLKYLNEKRIISLEDNEIENIDKSIYGGLYQILFNELKLTLDKLADEASILPKTIRDYRGYVGIAIEKRQQELKDMLEDIDCFTLSLSMQDADDSYNAALDEKNLNNKKLLFEQALSSYEEAYKLGADYVLDRIEEIKKILKSL